MRKGANVLSEQKKTYLIRRKICRGMICVFVFSILLILVSSIMFFFIFLDYTLEMSIESILISHSYSIVGDIIQVKKNDFMLAQNELKIGQLQIQSLIERRNFNRASLGGPDLNDISRFKKYCGSAYKYQKYVLDNGVPPIDFEQVHWYMHSIEFDEDLFNEQILKRLRGESTADYTYLSEQALDDIITCAASIYIRGNYSMAFSFTDLAKVQNFIGFESGIFCLYPNYEGTVLIYPAKEETRCVEREFFETNYPNDPIPVHYDPRCRSWYKAQWKSKYSYFSDVYRFYETGLLGITNCIPLWSRDGQKFYGSYCLDMNPSSDNTQFIKQYYKSSQDAVINYLIFDEDEEFKRGNVMGSKVFEVLESFTFNDDSKNETFSVTKIDLQNKQLNKLQEYLDEFKDEYDLLKVPS